MSNTEHSLRLEEMTATLTGSSARQLLLELFDEGSFVEIDRFAKSGDGPCEALAGFGYAEGFPVYAFAQDHNACFGAVGKAQAAKLQKIYQLAAQNGAPVVGIFNSDGSRLGEKLDAMDAISDLLSASGNISGVVPQIALIAGACIGSSSMIAANSDVLITTAGADYYLNPGDENGTGDIVVKDTAEGIETVKRLISLLPSNNLSAPPAYDFDCVMGECSGLPQIIDAVADSGSAVTLMEGECRAVLARISGTVCGMAVVSGDRISRADTGRLARFIRMCDSFSIPVASFVDAEGFEDTACAAQLSHAYAEATAVKLTVITGRAYGAVYIAAAGKSTGADAVLAWPQAVILPLSPKAAVPLLWRDRISGTGDDPAVERERLYNEYAMTEGSVLGSAGGYVTDIITVQETKSKLSALLDMLSGKRVSRLPKKHSNIIL